MVTLAEHLCLKRPNFQINPKQSHMDARLFFGEGTNLKIIDNIETGYMAGYVPRIYLQGSYGTGKTHLLYHLKDHFENVNTAANVQPFVVQIEAESRTRYQALHKRLMDSIGQDLLERVYMDFTFALGARREEGLRELFRDPNLYQVMQLLITGPANRTMAWRWLSGERLSTAEQQSLGVTSSVTETGQLVELIVTIGELFRRSNKHVLFLIDEGEALHNVSNGDAQRSWHDAFRRLADHNDNQSVGWILSIYSTLQDDPPGFIFEGDITSRLGQEGQVTLDPWAPVEVGNFLNDLLREFVDSDRARELINSEGLDTTPEKYPFTHGGFDAFVGHAGADSHNAIPRTILRAVTSCAIEALRTGSRILDATLVDRIVPQEFGARI